MLRRGNLPPEVPAFECSRELLQRGCGRSLPRACVARVLFRACVQPTRSACRASALVRRCRGVTWPGSRRFHKQKPQRSQPDTDVCAPDTPKSARRRNAIFIAPAPASLRLRLSVDGLGNSGDAAFERLHALQLASTREEVVPQGEHSFRVRNYEES